MITLSEFLANKGKKRMTIHCSNEEDYIILCEAFHIRGAKWRNGYSYNVYPQHFYNKNFCYTNDGKYGTIEFYKSEKIDIYEFEEVILYA